jgi:hypothetical protein
MVTFFIIVYGPEFFHFWEVEPGPSEIRRTSLGCLALVYFRLELDWNWCTSKVFKAFLQSLNRS